MKVSETNPRIQLAKVTGPREAQKTAPVDRVSAEQKRNLELMREEAVSASTKARAERLHAVRAQIREGIYQPDSNRIADEILRDAELEAMLRAVLT